MRTMILCLGHERLWSDDIAARVGRILKVLPLSARTTVRIVPALDWECVDAMVDHDQVMVVDTMNSGHAPGTCVVEEVSEARPPDRAPTLRLYCRHRKEVKDIEELVHLLALEGSHKRLVFVGVETDGARWDMPSSGGDIRSAVPLVVDSVLRSLGAEVALRRMVDYACAHPEAANVTDHAWDSRYQGSSAEVLARRRRRGWSADGRRKMPPRCLGIGTHLSSQPCAESHRVATMSTTSTRPVLHRRSSITLCRATVTASDHSAEPDPTRARNAPSARKGFLERSQLPCPKNHSPQPSQDWPFCFPQPLRRRRNLERSTFRTTHDHRRVRGCALRNITDRHPQTAATPAFIDSINADPDVALVLHVGDIHSGKQYCTEAYDQDDLRPSGRAFKDPLVYTPGDNEWTDCHKAAEGGGVYNEATGQIDYVLDASGNPVDYAKRRSRREPRAHPLASSSRDPGHALGGGTSWCCRRPMLSTWHASD